MAWNKELAKLKKELKSEEESGSKRPAPKPATKPVVAQALENEDALFLAAMGMREKATPLAPESPSEPFQAQPLPEKADFQSAMASLKGLKPARPVSAPPRKESKRLEAAPTPLLDTRIEPVVPSEPKAAPDTALIRSTPVMIQLAAGMAIEVDGSLDLRGHSPTDALERLKERILDGHLLGWRTLHINLGPSEDLRSIFQHYLSSPDADLVVRYAQAPIPMGGSQAWVLYLTTQGSTVH